VMTERERVFASIRREALDALPWQFDLTSAVAEKLKAYYHTDDLASATGDHIAFVGTLPPPVPDGEPPRPGLVRDEFGAVWRREARDLNYGDWGELVSHPLKSPDLAGIEFPEGATRERWSHVPEMRKLYQGRFLVAEGYGLFERGWSLCGFQEYLAYIAGEPQFVEALNERLADYSCRMTRQLAGLGADGIRFGDDWGLQKTLIMRPAAWRRLFKPYYRRIYDAARAAGLVVMIHSCGNITEILPDLIEIGVQVVHPLQPEAMDVVGCRNDFGMDLTFWGGLGSQSTIPRGTPEDNRREARRMLKLFSGGGYILAPAGAAPAETPPENIAAVVEVAKEQLK